MKADETATRLLDTAQQLVQRRGYNAFSYKDLAEAVGIRTASIHYHFPAKADLGKALMDRYQAELERTLEAIDRTGRSSKAKLKRFIKLYRDAESHGTICLCGSMASDQETLPRGLRGAVSAYLERSEGWVADRIAEGVRGGEFTFSGKPADAAAALVASLQGGLIVSRARHGRRLVDTVQREFLRAMEAA